MPAECTWTDTPKRRVAAERLYGSERRYVKTTPVCGIFRPLSHFIDFFPCPHSFTGGFLPSALDGTRRSFQISSLVFQDGLSFQNQAVNMNIAPIARRARSAFVFLDSDDPAFLTEALAPAGPVFVAVP